MKIKLLHSTPLEVCDISIGKCWDKQKDTPDLDRMYRVGVKNKHASTLEHLVVSYDIDGISRACLQELARHRIASLSVKSTRYTLKEVKDYEGSLSDFLVPTKNELVDSINISTMYRVQEALRSGASNDIVKYCIPEAFKTSLVFTINVRSLQNFLSLRTDKAALWEIQNLAVMLYAYAPKEYRFLLEDFVKGN